MSTVPAAAPNANAFLKSRRTTRGVRVGKLMIGSGHPIRVQTMTKGDTGDIHATFDEIIGLEATGCEMVRVSVPTMREAKVLGELKSMIKIPLVADIHFSAPLALEAIAQGVDKVRINPGNIGTREEVERVVRAAKQKGVAIRIETPLFFAARTTPSTSSRVPMLPGLIRTLSTPCAIASSASGAEKWMSATSGILIIRFNSPSTFASRIVGTDTRTISQPVASRPTVSSNVL